MDLNPNNGDETEYIVSNKIICLFCDSFFEFLSHINVSKSTKVELEVV